ncbi:DUF6446 family protein [Albidovulum sp.]
MNGRIVAGFILCAALVAGGAVWYAQEVAYYHPVTPADPAAAIALTTPAGAVEPIATADFRGIDAESSPLRFRACFTTPLSLAQLGAAFAPYPGAEPRNAPRQFDCFDAARIGADLEAGRARAFLSRRDIHPGFDRVVVVYPDGRAYAWHQPNASAER